MGDFGGAVMLLGDVSLRNVIVYSTIINSLCNLIMC